MSYGMLKPRRALALLVAMGFGLLGQIVAGVAMPMPLQVRDDMVAVGSAMPVSGGCPACPEQRNLPGSPAMMPGCTMAFCSMLPAVVPTGLLVSPVVRVSFPPVTVRSETGVTVRPDLGPPRPLRLT